MDLYSRKVRWKIYLALSGILILAMTLMYTNYLAKSVAERERQAVDLWVSAYETLMEHGEDVDYDLSYQIQIIQNNKYIPVIVTDENGVIEDNANFGSNPGKEYLEKQLAKIKRSGAPPIKTEFLGQVNYFYYKNSVILDRLKFYPIIQVILIASFIFLGYIGFSNARKAEQNRVWVGMAKETAHQLGTPISAMLAWMEHLKYLSEGNPEYLEVVDELTKDINRLELVSDRFSKIGSAPELTEKDLHDELMQVKAYMEKRAPRRVKFEFEDRGESAPQVKINAHLFEWVLENIIRNALDALDGEGTISARIHSDGKWACVDITDTGKGIPSSAHKKVFEPGYSTKKRGWGLGLSLAKRIIEHYHKGKIYVKQSEPGNGTTFTIKLPM
jgi:anti-sigma regulatory factor (Ser/Thr protein kinase)